MTPSFPRKVCRWIGQQMQWRFCFWPWKHCWMAAWFFVGCDNRFDVDLCVFNPCPNCLPNLCRFQELQTHKSMPLNGSKHKFNEKFTWLNMISNRRNSAVHFLFNYATTMDFNGLTFRMCQVLSLLCSVSVNWLFAVTSIQFQQNHNRNANSGCLKRSTLRILFIISITVFAWDSRRFSENFHFINLHCSAKNVYQH